jgi:hypothetical protein
MVCVAAFIVLAVMTLALPVVWVFSRRTARKIWLLFKNAWHCVGRRLTLRRCDNSFKDQIRNSLLRRVVLGHPNWVRPLSIAVELLSVLVVVIAVWSLVVSAKTIVMLAAYGTCDIVAPENCIWGSPKTDYTATIRYADTPVEWIVNWFLEFGDAIAYLLNH